MATSKNRTSLPPLGPFTGFPAEGVSFFRALAMNQRREWFQENRAAFDTLWAEPMRALVSELHAPLAKLYRGTVLKPGKIFRIHRDVRFSNDKTPYKTNVSSVFGLMAGPFDGPTALYFQLGLEDYAGAGSYALAPDALKIFRRRLLADKSGAAAEKALKTATKAGLTVGAMEKLKRAPPGVPVDHPRVELLKLKGLSLGTEEIPKKVRHSKALAPWLLAQAEAAVPTVRWLLAQKLYVSAPPER